MAIKRRVGTEPGPSRASLRADAEPRGGEPVGGEI